MRRLIASEFITLDGVMQAPGHDPHPDGKNTWALRYTGEDQQRFKVGELFESGAILLGRVTYEIFAAFWPTAPKDDGFADRMNDIPKYVVSKNLKTATWKNSTILSGNVAEETRRAEAATRRGHRVVRKRRSPQFAHQARPRRRVSADGVSCLAWKRKATFQRRERDDPSPGRRYLDLRFRRYRAHAPAVRPGPVEQVCRQVRVDKRADAVVAGGAERRSRARNGVVHRHRRIDRAGGCARGPAMAPSADRDDEAARTEVERFRGQFVKSTGDGTWPPLTLPRAPFDARSASTTR